MSRFRQMIPQRKNLACTAALNKDTVKEISTERLKTLAINGMNSGERMACINEMIRRSFEKGFSAGSDQTLTMMYAAQCLALNRLFGFGAKRCRDALVATSEEFLMHIDGDDAAAEVFSEIGLTFVKEAPFADEQF